MSSLRKDLISISSLPDDSFKRISDIATRDGEASIEWHLYLETIEEDAKEPSLALFRVLNYIGNAFADARDFDKEGSELDEFVSTLAKHNDDAAKGWEKLKASYKDLNTFFINKKEESIKSRFSNVTESSITLDARPVFSLDRASIEKMLYPFILKIETFDEKTFLCELYPDQLELLEEEIKSAKKKKLALEKLFGTSS